MKTAEKTTFLKGSWISTSIIRTIANLCRSQGFDQFMMSLFMMSSKWRHRILHKVGIDVFNYYFNTEFPIDMILRADNPYGTGHGADVPFTMGWYNNPGKLLNSWNPPLIGYSIRNKPSKISAIFKLVFCGVDPSDWEWGRDLDDIYRLEHLKDIFHDGHPKKALIFQHHLIGWSFSQSEVE